MNVKKAVWFFLIPVFFLFTGSMLGIAGTSSASSHKTPIAKQSQTERRYTKQEMKLWAKVDLEEFETPVYKAYQICGSRDRVFFVFDNHTGKIHRFVPGSEKGKLSQFVFGNGKGEGPGELSQVLDFKVQGDNLFFLDGVTNSIEVYSTPGEYKKRIQAPGGVLMAHLTFLKERLIVGTNMKEDRFLLKEQQGKWQEFGVTIDRRSIENPIYHDYTLSDPEPEGRYYHLPRYLGFVVQYRDVNLQFARETIDGLKIPKNIRGKKDNLTFQKINARYTTAECAGRFGGFLILKSVDREEKSSKWDIYRFHDFEYIASIRNPPAKTYSFAVSGNFLACLTEEAFLLFDLSDIGKELAAQGGK